MPVLVHDGAAIVESTVICEYVDEVFAARPLYPRTPLERARVRVWTKAVDEELHPACSAITYVVSHRHTIVRKGVGSFEEFLEAGASEGSAARTRKWQWIQQGLDAPGAGDKIRLYDSYLHKMEGALRESDWLVGSAFSMADIAMAPYVNRLAALAMEPTVGARPVAGRCALVRARAFTAHVRSRVHGVVAAGARRGDARER